MEKLKAITDELAQQLKGLRFAPPVAYVYNPLVYARSGYDLYLERFGASAKEIVMVGMNPGPWGMAQTGVPFGELGAVTQWMGISAVVEAPERVHPKKPVTGYDCPRSEVSGKRLWGWAQDTFGNPERFFDRFFVANYCPLMFLEAGGRNLTPDKLKTSEKRRLFEACDLALRKTIDCFRPAYVIGVGKFAGERARSALADLNVTIGSITHPSPANPKANRGWSRIIGRELRQLGIEI